MQSLDLVNGDKDVRGVAQAHDDDGELGLGGKIDGIAAGSLVLISSFNKLVAMEGRWIRE